MSLPVARCSAMCPSHQATRPQAKAGENIVVNGLQRVRPGAVVAPQPVPMTAKAELASDPKEAKNNSNSSKSPAA